MKRTPGWIVGLSAAAIVFGLLVMWLALPWPEAAFATLVAWMAFDLGCTGTHWYRDNHHD